MAKKEIKDKQRSLIFLELLYQFLATNGLQDILGLDVFPDELPSFFAYESTYRPTSTLLLTATGSSFGSRQEALFSCLMESYERTAATLYRPLLFPASQSVDTVLDPARYLSRTMAQDHAFTEAWNETRQGKVLVPAQLVAPADPRFRKEPRLGARDSTGFASGFERSETVYRALMEVVERDAFMNLYLYSVTPPRIDPRTIADARMQSILKDLELHSLQTHILDITNDLSIPAYASIITDRSGTGPAMTMGLGAGFRHVDAIMHALREAYAARLWLRHTMIGKNIKKPKQTNPSVSSHDKRITLLADAAALEVYGFLFAGPLRPAQSHPAKADELLRAVRSLAMKGYETFVVDVPGPGDGTLGIHTCRVLVPGLQPLTHGSLRSFVVRERLTIAARFFGIQNPSYNQVPHPFL